MGIVDITEKQIEKQKKQTPLQHGRCKSQSK